MLLNSQVENGGDWSKQQEGRHSLFTGDQADQTDDYPSNPCDRTDCHGNCIILMIGLIIIITIILVIRQIIMIAIITLISKKFIMIMLIHHVYDHYNEKARLMASVTAATLNLLVIVTLNKVDIKIIGINIFMIIINIMKTHLLLSSQPSKAS